MILLNDSGKKINTISTSSYMAIQIARISLPTFYIFN